MPRQRIRDRSSGFISVAYLLIIVLALGLIGLAAWRISLRAAQKPGDLSYKSKNFGLDLSVDADSNFDQQAYLTVYFDDSIKSDPCPVSVGISGHVNTSYTGRTVKLSITQGSPPAKPDTSEPVGVACPQDIVPAYSIKVRLDRGWLTGGAAHTVIANGQSYGLAYDKQNYTLKLQKPDARAQTVVYPPDKVVFLFSHEDSDYRTCMSKSELRDYAKQHDLALVSDRYPGFESAFHQLQPGVLTSSYYSPLLLVVANDGLKSVVQAELHQKPDGQCHLWVGTLLNISQITD